ncbi:hypothetical protein CFB81_22520 [Burkholderia sp. AU28863]|uniref:hypothetical protein n=1 Tax=Burkholderia sp. AU28863 TaxID=2015352 RepID=UPI000B79C2AA|nr:hypothetical protein [Burkholderia sp. AU28863]OXI67435.1 hypothetical protein CFB81_22520 [Burkholderia sp. AU28863]
MTTNTYGGYTVDQLREFIRHHYDAEHGGDNIDELTNDSSASVKIVRDLLDAIEPQQDGDPLRPIARWVYNAVRVNLNLLHGICSEFGCQQGEDVATWLRARLAGVPTPCMCSGVGPCEERTDGSCRRERAIADAAEPVARINAVGGINGIAWRHRDIASLAPGTMLYAGPQPPAQAPVLTREEIGEAWRKAGSAGVEKVIRNAPAQADAREGLTSDRITELYRESRYPSIGWAHRFARAIELELLTAHPGNPGPRASTGVIAAALAVIEADRSQTLTTEHVNALDNAIKIQHGDMTLPEPRAEESPDDQRDGTRWRALMKNGEPEVYVERTERRAIQRTRSVAFSHPNLIDNVGVDTTSEMWVRRYVMFAWWERENEHRKFIEAVDAIGAGQIQ